MNPHQRNKIDINSLSPEEQRLFRLYGKLPNKKDLLQNKLKERKYFDSGDYALSKAGKASDAGVTQIGSQHPNPENIPHLTSPGNGNGNGHMMMGPGGHIHQGSSPVKESSFLHRETSINDQDELDGTAAGAPTAAAGGDVRGGGSGAGAGTEAGTEAGQEDESRPDKESLEQSVSPPPAVEGMPIRQ